MADAALPLASAHTLAAMMRGTRGQAVELGNGLSNLLPMTLVALARLGAEPPRLVAFADGFRALHDPEPAPPERRALDEHDWRHHLGQRSQEGAYRQFFAREVACDGWAAAQRLYLPVLVIGIAAGGLAALMRLAYGNLCEDPDEIATALGYWATTFLPLREAGSGSQIAGTDRPTEILDLLRGRDALCHLSPPTGLAWHWMRGVASRPEFPAVVDVLRPAPDLLARVANASLALAAAAPDLEQLSPIEVAHWLRVLEPVWPDPGLAVRYAWQAIAAAYPSMGMPALADARALNALRRRTAPSWPELARLAVQADDERAICFTFSAREEAGFYQEPLYRVLAARRLGCLS